LLRPPKFQWHRVQYVRGRLRRRVVSDRETLEIASPHLYESVLMRVPAALEAVVCRNK